jgi:mevalonate pyrophosphate decarboxylase
MTSICYYLEDIISKLQLQIHSWNSAKCCFDCTRVAFLNSLTAWAISPQLQKKIFWLHGPAGSGKSSIATTLAMKFRNQKKLGAYFFFSHGVAGQNTPEKVFTTLACGLASYDSGIEAALAIAVMDPHLQTYDLTRQFIELVLHPLSYSHKTEPMLVILERWMNVTTMQSYFRLSEMALINCHHSAVF